MTYGTPLLCRGDTARNNIPRLFWTVRHGVTVSVKDGRPGMYQVRYLFFSEFVMSSDPFMNSVRTS